VVNQIESVDGVEILVPPTTPSYGPRYQTLTVVQFDPEVKLSEITEAIEGAQTSHRDTIPPIVVTAISGRLKADTKPDDITEALQKAGLFEEPPATPEGG
jgi:hypothetical protein